MVAWAVVTKDSERSLVIKRLKEFSKRLCGIEFDVATFISIHTYHKNVPTKRFFS